MILMLLHRCKEFCILVGLYLAGDYLSSWLGLLLPGSLVGMLLLTIGLFSGILKLEQVETVSDYLLRHLNLLFIPAGVGIMIYGERFLGNAVEILLNVMFSTVIVLAVTGKVVDTVIDWLEPDVKPGRHAE